MEFTETSEFTCPLYSSKTIHHVTYVEDERGIEQLSVFRCSKDPDCTRCIEIYE
ncbi:MAG: hypothetical protein ACK5MN_02000 [Lachnospiraceae bacterium]